MDDSVERVSTYQTGDEIMSKILDKDCEKWELLSEEDLNSTLRNYIRSDNFDNYLMFKDLDVMVVIKYGIIGIEMTNIPSLFNLIPAYSIKPSFINAIRFRIKYLNGKFKYPLISLKILYILYFILILPALILYVLYQFPRFNLLKDRLIFNISKSEFREQRFRKLLNK